MLEFKEDWKEARDRLSAWWLGEDINRPILAIYAPKETVVRKKVRAPKTFMERRTNIDYRIRNSEIRMRNTFFGGEAFPLINTEIGPGDLALYLGAEPIFREDAKTVWYKPVISDLDLDKHLEFDPENKWWKFHCDFIVQASKRSFGRYLIGMPDLIEGLDTLAQLRGHEKLLVDLFKRPKWVHARLEEITELYFIYYNHFYEKIKDDVGGNAFSVYRIWAPGRTSKVQSDISAFLSPRMFKEFVDPYLRRQCSQLDFVLYHLDGPNAIQHLDILLKIPEITMIQWVPGAGEEPPESQKWRPLYKKILEAGKSIWLHVPFNCVENMIATLNSKRLFIIADAPTEMEAKKLLQKLS
ncbi:MAG: hypothetical protein RMJ07_03335 [Nitrososphaerota archaeon]|nr:hypothetical protein [Candidatus Bathyarchaeota archaeon]MDW8048697.1 hypothetical protein [Nitrososphaerota archaeon]